MYPSSVLSWSFTLLLLVFLNPVVPVRGIVEPVPSCYSSLFPGGFPSNAMCHQAGMPLVDNACASCSSVCGATYDNGLLTSSTCSAGYIGIDYPNSDTLAAGYGTDLADCHPVPGYPNAPGYNYAQFVLNQNADDGIVTCRISVTDTLKAPRAGSCYGSACLSLNPGSGSSAPQASDFKNFTYSDFCFPQYAEFTSGQFLIEEPTNPAAVVGSPQLVGQHTWHCTKSTAVLKTLIHAGTHFDTIIDQGSSVDVICLRNVNMNTNNGVPINTTTPYLCYSTATNLILTHGAWPGGVYLVYNGNANLYKDEFFDYTHLTGFVGTNNPDRDIVYYDWGCSSTSSATACHPYEPILLYLTPCSAAQTFSGQIPTGSNLGALQNGNVPFGSYLIDQICEWNPIPYSATWDTPDVSHGNTLGTTFFGLNSTNTLQSCPFGNPVSPQPCGTFPNVPSSTNVNQGLYAGTSYESRSKTYVKTFNPVGGATTAGAPYVGGLSTCYKVINGGSIGNVPNDQLMFSLKAYSGQTGENQCNLVPSLSVVTLKPGIKASDFLTAITNHHGLGTSSPYTVTGTGTLIYTPIAAQAGGQGQAVGSGLFLEQQIAGYSGSPVFSSFIPTMLNCPTNDPYQTMFWLTGYARLTLNHSFADQTNGAAPNTWNDPTSPSSFTSLGPINSFVTQLLSSANPRLNVETPLNTNGMFWSQYDPSNCTCAPGTSNGVGEFFANIGAQSACYTTDFFCVSGHCQCTRYSYAAEIASLYQYASLPSQFSPWTCLDGSVSDPNCLQTFQSAYPFQSPPAPYQSNKYPFQFATNITCCDITLSTCHSWLDLLNPPAPPFIRNNLIGIVQNQNYEPHNTVCMPDNYYKAHQTVQYNTSCVCIGGWIGNRCQICDNSKPWFGINCDITCSSPDGSSSGSAACLNGGVCSINQAGNQPFCTCANNFTGANCQYPVTIPLSCGQALTLPITCVVALPAFGPVVAPFYNCYMNQYFLVLPDAFDVYTTLVSTSISFLPVNVSTAQQEFVTPLIPYTQMCGRVFQSLNPPGSSNLYNYYCPLPYNTITANQYNPSVDQWCTLNTNLIPFHYFGETVTCYPVNYPINVAYVANSTWAWCHSMASSQENKLLCRVSWPTTDFSALNQVPLWYMYNLLYAQCQPGSVAGLAFYNSFDTCGSSACLNGGTCVTGPALSGTYNCTCPQFFTGPRCASFGNNCPSVNPCQHNGTCVSLVGPPGTYTCSCPFPYTGPNCTYTDVCDFSHPCQNGGLCFNAFPSNFTCSCQGLYSGTTCNIYNACTDGSRTNTVCGYPGSGPSGTGGVLDCVYVYPESYYCNPCLSHPCGGGTCTYTGTTTGGSTNLNAFTCSCILPQHGSYCQLLYPGVQQYALFPPVGACSYSKEFCQYQSYTVTSCSNNEPYLTPNSAIYCGYTTLGLAEVGILSGPGTFTGVATCCTGGCGDGITCCCTPNTCPQVSLFDWNSCTSGSYLPQTMPITAVNGDYYYATMFNSTVTLTFTMSHTLVGNVDTSTGWNFLMYFFSDSTAQSGQGSQAINTCTFTPGYTPASDGTGYAGPWHNHLNFSFASAGGGNYIESVSPNSTTKTFNIVCDVTSLTDLTYLHTNEAGVLGAPWLNYRGYSYGGGNAANAQGAFGGWLLYVSTQNPYVQVTANDNGNGAYAPTTKIYYSTCCIEAPTNANCQLHAPSHCA